jgi:hypothetical protein
MIVAYNLTRAKLASITDAEVAFSTERLLPKCGDIPRDFFNGNIYTRIAEAIFFGGKIPSGELHFREGFIDDAAATDLRKCIQAHIGSFGPKHEHKIAGVGYMFSQVCEVTADVLSA